MLSVTTHSLSLKSCVLERSQPSPESTTTLGSQVIPPFCETETVTSPLQASPVGFWNE